MTLSPDTGKNRIIRTEAAKLSTFRLKVAIKLRLCAARELDVLESAKIVWWQTDSPRDRAGGAHVAAFSLIFRKRVRYDVALFHSF